MNDTFEVWLHSMSVVVTAEHHNPSILNKDFLINSGIVPQDWSAKEFVTTSDVSFIKYSNDVRLFVDQNRLSFYKKINAAFAQHKDGKVCNLASLYVLKQPYVSYSGLGLNYAVSILNENPKEWITNKFLVTKFHDQGFHVHPKFIIPLSDSVLSLSFRNAPIKQGIGQEVDGIRIMCNVSFNGPFESVSDIHDKITGWHNIKEKINSKLRYFLDA